MIAQFSVHCPRCGGDVRQINAAHHTHDQKLVVRCDRGHESLLWLRLLGMRSPETAESRRRPQLRVVS